MASVKCVSLTGDSLPGGRRLIPGQVAHQVDVAHPAVLAKINAGRLVITGEDFDVAGSTVPGVLEWVADNPERAATALAAETARGTDARKSLTDKLTELVATPDDSEEE